jgi:transglutaminase-like putative cysteine protease
VLYRTNHITRYLYEEPVSQCFNELRLTPRPSAYQRVHETKINLDPEPAETYSRKDYFGNDVTTFAIFQMHDCFTATVTSLVEVLPHQPELVVSLPWEEARDMLATQPDAASLEASEYIFDSPYVTAGRELAEYARPTFAAGRPLFDAVQELSHRIHTEFTYKPKSTTIDTPLLDVLRKRSGVCQDFAHIMIGALRSLHLAARYVSGYLRSGVNYVGAESSHAWVSVFVPGSGWLSFDPTNDVAPGEGHVTLAYGRDYGDVTPVKGIALGGGGQNVEVEVRVQPETPTDNSTTSRAG